MSLNRWVQGRSFTASYTYCSDSDKDTQRGDRLTTCKAQEFDGE